MASVKGPSPRSSGNFDVSTLMTAKATMKDGNKKVNLLRILTAPSQKSKPYWCTLAFLEDGSGDYVETPTSRCDCPAGALFCSHMLSFLLILHVTQTLKEDIKNTDDLQKYMPEFVFSFKSMLFPVDHVYAGSKTKKAASRVITGVSSKKKKRQR